jgi:exodeoxyribonuclease VII small subunit
MPRTPDKRASSPAVGVTPPGGAGTGPDASSSGADDGLGIDAVLDRLESVVRDLEGGELPIERALERFEQGVHLARRGNQMLDRVEQRVEMLLADRDETVPMPNAGPNAGDDEDAP